MTAFMNAGYHREDWYGYLDGDPKILNAMVIIRFLRMCIHWLLLENTSRSD